MITTMTRRELPALGIIPERCHGADPQYGVSLEAFREALVGQCRLLTRRVGSTVVVLPGFFDRAVRTWHLR
jgi:hypothetical protein